VEPVDDITDADVHIDGDVSRAANASTAPVAVKDEQPLSSSGTEPPSAAGLVSAATAFSHASNDLLRAEAAVAALSGAHTAVIGARLEERGGGDLGKSLSAS
jgi:hypothetical protein